jgi:hypothetical protein
MKIKFPTNIGKRISLKEWLSFDNSLQDRIMKNCITSDDIERIIYGKKKDKKICGR